MKKMFIKSSLLLILGGLCTAMMIPSNKISDKYVQWEAPTWSDTLTNPLKGNKNAIEKGQELYGQFCAVCHGEQGKGNGAGGYKIIPAPADHSSNKVQKQSDGAIFWKITTGRLPMSPYENIFSKEQRWQLVNYIRTLKQN